MEEAKGGRFVSYVPEKLYQENAPTELSERTKIITEIAVRFLELKEEDGSAPIILLEGLLQLHNVSPDLLFTTLKILAGNSLAGVSLAQLAQEADCSKQNVHQTQKRHLKALHKTQPEVASVIAEILGRSNWKTAKKTQQKTPKNSSENLYQKDK
jgi:lambda repressor-like predicted transcriptional regulator